MSSPPSLESVRKIHAHNQEKGRKTHSFHPHNHAVSDRDPPSLAMNYPAQLHLHHKLTVPAGAGGSELIPHSLPEAPSQRQQYHLPSNSNDSTVCKQGKLAGGRGRSAKCVPSKPVRRNKEPVDFPNSSLAENVKRDERGRVVVLLWFCR